MNGGREASGITGGHAVVGVGRIGLERDADGGSGRVTRGLGGGCGLDGNRYMDN